MSYFSFDITRSGLFTAQKGLKVTQNNITNANTDGYAREQLVIGELAYNNKGSLDTQMGDGSMPLAVNRIVDEQFIKESRNQQGEVGYYGTMNSRLSEVESLFNETGDQSVSSLMKDFFNTWEEASKYPEDLAYRQTLIGKGSSLTNVINSISTQLRGIKDVSDQRIESSVGKVNELTKKIADINKKIIASPGVDANPLIDEQDRYLNELSKYVDINIQYDDKGISTISSGNGLLVSKTDAYTVKGIFDNDTQKWKLANNSGGMITPTKGSLAAEIEVRNNTINGYEDKLNTLVSTLINQVNTHHQTGYGLDGTTGVNFFDGTDAASVRISSAVENNPEKIGLSSANGKTGNSDIGKLIAALSDKPVLSGGTESLITYHQRMVFDMGTDLSNASLSEQMHENVLTQIESQKNEVQGVNIDEEMMNMMQFQHFYQANARTMQTLNSMYDSLLEVVK